MRRDDLRSAGTASSHVAAGTSARSASTAQNIIGVIVVVGAALAIIGCLLPWTGRRISPANAFDQGYITGDGYWSYSDNPGNDGVIILAAALGAGALGVHYFIRRNALAGLGVLGLGVSVAAVAGFNLGKIIQAVNELYGSATEGVGDGVYLTVAGGVIIAVAALVGLLQSAALAGAGAESSAYSPAQPARGGMKGSCALCGKTGLDADEIRVLDDGRWACQHCATTQAMQ